jgi:hypothetical protein
MKNRYLLAIAAVCAVTIMSTESNAQQVRGQVINNTINNSYNGGGYGYGWNQPNRTYNYNCTGCYAGSGPYDSNIAVSGIGAAAGIIGMLIQNNRPAPVQQPQQIVIVTPQQPQSTVIYTQPFPVRQAPQFGYGR